MNRLVLVLGLAVLTGCSAVKSSRIRSDYETVDKFRVKRLAVITQPLPDNNPEVGEMWSLIARRYVYQNRDFIPKSHIARPGQPEDPAFKDQCTEGIDGVLWLAPDVKRQGKGVESSVSAKLLRCADGEEVWAAEAAGSWDSEDERYKELTTQYMQEFTPAVGPYVGPTFRLLMATLNTLPTPKLSDEEIMEKIEFEE
jgi:probable lipoprotein (TIGR04455 family)